jgi:hypothetical protein
MSRISLAFLPFLATPALAHEGLHHHPHGIEFGWLGVALLGSIVGGGAVYAVLRWRK